MSYRVHITHYVFATTDQDRPLRVHLLIDLPFIPVPGMRYTNAKEVQVTFLSVTWDERRQTFLCGTENGYYPDFETPLAQGWRLEEPV